LANPEQCSILKNITDGSYYLFYSRCCVYFRYGHCSGIIVSWGNRGQFYWGKQILYTYKDFFLLYKPTENISLHMAEDVESVQPMLLGCNKEIFLDSHCNVLKNFGRGTNFISQLHLMRCFK
jgi:hypothetical protein